MRRCWWIVVVTATAWMAFAAAPARADFVVVPNSLAGVEGNSNNSGPFNIAQVGLTEQRYQQVYAASQFAAIPAGGAFITQITFRPDASTGAAFSSTLPSIRIDLSTTGAAPDALSTTFASNTGADDAIVFGGPFGAPLTLSSAFTGPAGGPKDFDIVINLTRSFFYDPSLGNLLLDVRNFGGGATTPFDAQTTAGDSVSRAFTAGSGVNSATADFTDTLGLVTRFTTTAVPEPGTLALFGTAALGLAVGVRWRRRPKRRGDQAMPQEPA
jgi:PEP-CTERM motif